MRVVHVVHSFHTGGMEKGLATIVRNASEGIEHSVVCLSQAGASVRLLPPGTRVVELGKPPGHSLPFLFRLARTLKRLEPQVVHTRNWGGLDGVIASRIAGIRSVIHGEHGWAMEDRHGSSARRVWIRRFLARWIREYTCVSRQMEEWLRSIVGNRRPVTQIYNGVDSTVYSPGPGRGRVRMEFGIPADAFVVTICSRLDPIKDHPTLFRALRSAHESGVAARLFVVGDGPERDRLEKEAVRGTIFLGDRRDVPDILRETDVFALPSLNEGISNTILEAMATGLPVVATNVGGNPELVEHDVTGTLIQPGDHADLARALLGYFRSPSRRAEHGMAGRQRALREFDIAAMTDAYERIYLRCGRQDRAA